MHSFFMHVASLGIEVGVACVGVRLGGVLGSWLKSFQQ